MEIYFHTEDVVIPDIDYQKLKNWIANAISSEGRKYGDLSFIFCSDKYLLRINQEYLNHNYLTDIITFDYSSEDIEGDIFISWERIEENANLFNVEIEEEFRRICIHGILHLLGYNDKSVEDKKIMTSKEDFYLEKFI